MSITSDINEERVAGGEQVPDMLDEEILVVEPR